jgi:hypothetical protein
MLGSARRLAVRRLRYNANRRGLLGGHRGWLAVLVALRVGDWARSVAKRGPGTIRYAEPLARGEAIEIRHLGPDDRR